MILGEYIAIVVAVFVLGVAVVLDLGWGGRIKRTLQALAYFLTCLAMVPATVAYLLPASYYCRKYKKDCSQCPIREICGGQP